MRVYQDSGFVKASLGTGELIQTGIKMYTYLIQFLNHLCYYNFDRLQRWSFVQKAIVQQAWQFGNNNNNNNNNNINNNNEVLLGAIIHRPDAQNEQCFIIGDVPGQYQG